MSPDEYDKELQDQIPEFTEKQEEIPSAGSFDMSSTASAVTIHGWKQILGIIAVAIVVIGGWELSVRIFNVPTFVLPSPSAIVKALILSLPNIYTDFLFTLTELVSGYLIGASIGLVLAALLIQVRRKSHDALALRGWRDLDHCPGSSLGACAALAAQVALFVPGTHQFTRTG